MTDCNCVMCQRVGGPMSCGCPPPFHKGYCKFASEEVRMAYVEEAKKNFEPIAKAIRKGLDSD